MIRTAAALMLTIAVTSPAPAQTSYRLEGVLTGGTTLFTPADPNVPFHEYGAPDGGFPVPYIAQLALGPSDDQWSFEFTGFDDNGGEHHEVDGPEGALRPDLMFNEVTLTNSTVAIEFRDQPFYFERFDLTLDLATETGTWQWIQDCPVCDLVFPRPSATATITRVTLIPEPSAGFLAIGAACGALAWGGARRRWVERVRRTIA